MESSLSKVACVSGASSGIGAEICVKLANLGYTVIGIARRLEKITELPKRLNGSAGKIIGRKCDIEIESEVAENFDWIKSEFNRLDVFVNNAGVMIAELLIDDDVETFRKMFNVNVIGSCVCLREAIRVMRTTTQTGDLIVVNSILGHRIPDIPRQMRPSFGVYPATKHSLTALCQTVRQELSYLKLPLRLMSISPGMVETDMINGMDPDLVSQLPKLKIGDVADAVLYAISTPQHVLINEMILTPTPMI